MILYLKSQITSFIAERIVGAAAKDTLFFHLLFLDFRSQGFALLTKFRKLHLLDFLWEDL